MRHLLAILLLAVPLSGCSVLGMGGRTLRPELFVHGKAMRAAMINPAPPLYGDGNPGGCMVWSEFRVEISDLVMDGAGTLRVRGFVGAWTKGHRLSNVQIAYVRGGSTAGVVYSGPNGEFTIAGRPGESAKLVLSHASFRALELDLDRLARAARPAS